MNNFQNQALNLEENPFAEFVTQPAAEDDNPFAEFVQPNRQAKGLSMAAAPEPFAKEGKVLDDAKRNQPGIASDMWGSFGMGSGQLLSGAGWLFGSEALGDTGDSTTEYWEKTLSDAQRDSMGKRFVNEDFSAGDALTDPRSWAGMIAQSLPAMAAGMGGAALGTRGALALGAGNKAAVATGAVAGSAMEGATIAGMVGDETYKAVMTAPPEQISQSPYFQDLIKLGTDEQQARAQTAQKAAEAAALPAGVGGAILGVAFNKFVGDAVTGSLSSRFTKESLKGGAIEGSTEVAQGLVESGSKQAALNEYANQDYNLSEVANEMVAGGGAGFAMGSTVGGLGSLASKDGEQPERRNSPDEVRQEPFIGDQDPQQANIDRFFDENPNLSAGDQEIPTLQPEQEIPTLQPEQQVMPGDDLGENPFAEFATASNQSSETGVYRVPVDSIKVDPKAYQFRTKVNESGVDNRLDSVNKWDDKRGGSVLLHRRNDGSVYVADGHHRVNLAKRLGQKEINAQFMDEAEGVSVEDAMTEAAMTNIANDKAEPVDIAKVLRHKGGSLSDHDLPTTKMAKRGESISKLNDNVFGMTVNGQIADEDAAIIGNNFEQSKQDAAANIFQKIKPGTEYQRQLLANEIKAAEFAQSQGDQGGLFGDDPQEVSLMQDRLKVLESLRTRLNTDKKLFSTLNKNAEKASSAGNKIATDANSEITKQSAKSLDLISRVSTTPSLNEMVNRSAKRVYDGEKVSEVSRDLQAEIMSYARPEKSGSQEADAAQEKPRAQSGEQTDPVRTDDREGERLPTTNATGTDSQGQRGAREPVRGEAEGDLLTTYTESELKEKAAKQKLAEEIEAKATKAAEDKEKADLAVDGFDLTGSSLPADANPNQNDIFDTATDQPIKPTGNRKGSTETFEFPDGSIQSRSDDEVRKSDQAKPKSDQAKPQKQKSRKQEQSEKFLNADRGDTVVFSDDIGYASKGKPYKITQIGKDGSVFIESERGSGTSISYGEVIGAINLGIESSVVANDNAEKPKVSANKVFTEDAANKARELLRKKLGQLNSGIDPELLQAGITLAGYHIEKGARTFSAYAKAMTEDLGDSVRPYLKSWYMGVKYDPRAANFDGMSSASEVESASTDPVSAEPAPAQSIDDLILENISELKSNQHVKSLLAKHYGVPYGEVTDAQTKAAQEAIEVALVRKSREIASNNKGNDKKAYLALLDLYMDQPSLNVRSSTSIENQAYSTPAPIAYLASRMAGITDKSSVYEPTAGNGMLLIGADTKRATVNELDVSRAKNLESLGFDVTSNDATKFKPKGQHDAVIMNPPFGKLRNEHGELAPIKHDGYTIKSIDHLIAVKALEAMSDNGKSTIIIGADKVAGQINSSDRIFFNWLYSNYNVTDHFEVDGNLYKRQGAGWPIRIITVNGRSESDSLAPKSGTVERFNNWDDIYEHYKQGLDSKGEFVGSGTQSSSDRGEQRPGNDKPDISKLFDGQTGTTDSRGESGRNAGQRDRDSAGLVERSRNEPGERSSSSANLDGQPVLADRQGANEQGANEPAGSSASEKSNAKQPSKRSSDKPVNASGFQTAYQAKSAGFNESVLTPNNMAGPIQYALSDIEKSVGNIDEYVMSKLGYSSKEALHKAFMGLQVDAVAATIFNFEKRNKGVIIADQTGVGKGRQAAGIIRYAAREGKIPVFVTVKENLFTDMFDDLADIGSDNIAPFILNADSAIKRKDGGKLFANKSKGHKALIKDLAKSRSLPEGRNAIFLTYSQINTPNEQRDLLRALSKDAIFVLDESHNAAGEQVAIKKVRGQTVKQQTGAGFINEVINNRPVLYLSATFAKRPDNMVVYYRTDLMDAVDKPSELVDAVSSGGVPLQSAMSAMLAKSGQLIRRERSFEGISIPVVFDKKNKDKHVKISDQVTTGLRAVVEADRLFHDVFFEEYKEQAQESGYDLGSAGNKSSQTIDHTNFNAVVHNYVRQLLLSLKAEEAANKAIAAFKKGIKPVIALENTMGSFLSEYAKDMGLSQGDVIEADYRDVMLRALDRSRRLTIKNQKGEKKTVDIPLSTLDPVTREAFKNAERTIQGLSLDSFPISPIDLMRQRLKEAGIKVSEITGRNLIIDYSGEKPVLASRPSEELDARRVVDRFNSGTVDALIINRAGSTGLSIHASEKFKDKRPRHMIVAQTMQDINILVQMLGRINRTGQVVLPTYELMGLDLPSEKRPLAKSSRNMKSLNANTSANEDSDSSLNIPDMYNKYGDQIVAAFLAENTEIASMVGMSALGEESSYDGMALKFTGRLALLPVKKQEEVYAQIEPAYESKIEYLTKTGQNDLIASTMDADARALESKIVYEGKKPGTIFGGHTTLHKTDIKFQGKPPLAEDVESAINSELKDRKPEQVAADLIESKSGDEGRMMGAIESKLSGARKAVDDYQAKGKTKPERIAALEGEIQRLEALKGKYISHVSAMKAAVKKFKVGTIHELNLGGETVLGAVTEIKDLHKGSGDPWAGSKVKARFMVNSGIRSIDVPISDLSASKDIHQRVVSQSTIADVFSESFDSNAREIRYIATGNLIAGSAKLKGRIVNFTDNKGATHQGILMPKNYGQEGEFSSTGSDTNFVIRDAKIAAKFLKENESKLEFAGGIFSATQTVRISKNNKGWFVSVPKANKSNDGRDVKFDEGLRKLTGDFYGSGATMFAHFDESKLSRVASRVLDITPLYALPSMRDAWVKAGGAKQAEASSSFDDLPAFSRSRKFDPADAIQKADLKKVVDAFMSDYNGNIPLDVIIVENQEDIYGPERTAEKFGRIEGAYHAAFGKVVLVRTSLRDIRTIQRVLRHEVLGHYGLDTFKPEDKKALLERIIQSRKVPGLRSIWKQIDKLYENDTEMHKAEEVFAFVTEQEDTVFNRFMDYISEALRKLLRKAGFFKGIISKKDLQETAKIIAEGIRDGSRQQQNFPKNDSDQFSMAETSAGRMKTFFDGIKNQPIDRMFRVPFDVAGQVDSHGRFKAGVKLKDSSIDILKNWKPHPEGRFAFLDGIIETARHGLMDRYKLSDEYKATFREAEAVGRGLDMKALDILKTLEESGVDAAEAAVLQKMLTGEQVEARHLDHLSAPIQAAIEELGLMAVEYGIITREQFERNRGAYLHRSYRKHEAQFTGLGKLILNQQSKRVKRKIAGKSAKGRGLEIKIPMDRLLKHVPESWFGIRKTGPVDMNLLNNKKFIVLENPGVDPRHTETFEGMQTAANNRTLERIYWPHDQSIPNKYRDWRNKGTFEVRGGRKGNVVLWRDYTKAEREHMGEIVDARYNIAKTFLVISNDIAMGKFFQDVSRNSEWFLEDLPPNQTALTSREAESLSNLSKTDWVHVPDTTITKTAGTKSWGALAGGYVRAEIWRDLVELDKLHNPNSGALGTWQKLLTQWKLNKTARSPVVHMNNVMSNMIFMDLADVRMTDLYSGLKSYQAKDEHWRSAQEHGAFEGTFANEELRRTVMEPILNEIMQQNVDANNSLEDRTQSIWKITTAIYKKWRTLDSKMVGMYQVEDEIFRMATYMRRISLGDSGKEAALIARETFLDYDIRAPWVNAARRTVLPFISYTYRAVPIVYQAIMDRPWKLAKYATLAAMANSLTYMLEPGDEDEERRTMREDQQGSTWIGTERMMRLGRDELGDPVFIDIRRWIPVGDVFDLNQGSSAIGIPSWLQFGGPLMIAAEFALNKQAFTGRELTKETDTGIEKTSKVADWLYKSWMPSAAYIPGSHYWDKTGAALTDSLDRMGNPVSVPEALFSSVGIKIQSHNVELGKSDRARGLSFEVRLIKADIRTAAIQYERNAISKAELNKIVASSEKKLRLLQDKANKLNNGSN